MTLRSRTPGPASLKLSYTAQEREIVAEWWRVIP